jgi:glycosyltransferase involved in cell wall biosynthesis
MEKFSILVVTQYNRTGLDKLIDSLVKQTYPNWEMVLVNDTPRKDPSYGTLVINDPRIRYYRNETKTGLNYSKNFCLKHLAIDTSWILYLDDNEYLSPDALMNFRHTIISNPGKYWITCNKASQNGTPLVPTLHEGRSYKYLWGKNLLSLLDGNGAHCIHVNLLKKSNADFSSVTQKPEDWYFYFQINKYSNLLYSDHNSIISIPKNIHLHKSTPNDKIKRKTKVLLELFYKKKITFLGIMYYALYVLGLIKTKNKTHEPTMVH